MTAIREFHPVADMFPLRRGEAFRELVEDIRKNGLREPIVEDAEGRILDGRNRYREGEGSQAELALSLNLHRRHLDESQRALVAARLAKLMEVEAVKRRGRRRKENPANLQGTFPGESRVKAAMVNVSAQSISYAIKVIRGGCEEVIAAVESSGLAVSTAAALTRLPQEEQAQAVAGGAKQAVARVREMRGGGRGLGDFQPGCPPATWPRVSRLGQFAPLGPHTMVIVSEGEEKMNRVWALHSSRTTVGKLHRIAFILTLAVLWATSLAVPLGRAQGTSSPKPHVNSQRLQGTLEKLSEFGRNPEGGVTRIGFSETDLAAREYVTSLMKQAGLEVHVDPAGNLFGRRAGSEELPTLLFGSHIDSVPHGGNFDGDVGSMGAIEVIRALNDGSVKTRHPLEVVIWTNEEGHHFGLGTLGSGVAAGLLGPEILERKDEQGRTLADWLRRYGQDPSHLTDARIPRRALAGYLELHIEQGPILDETKVPIGVVQGIVGLKRWKCVATGFANHAGTTPMNRRKDALAAASKDVLAIREVVRAEAGRQVGTVGYMKAEPGATNVIPGRVEFPVELRDLDAAKIDSMWERIQERFKETDKEENVETQCTQLDDVAPARTDSTLQTIIREAAKAAGLATSDLPSGAVQDAQQIAKIAPMGMIFVPSRNGISHSPKEFTSWEDVANGAEVLYRSVLLLDDRLNRN